MTTFYRTRVRVLRHAEEILSVIEVYFLRATQHTGKQSQGYNLSNFLHECVDTEQMRTVVSLKKE